MYFQLMTDCSKANVSLTQKFCNNLNTNELTSYGNTCNEYMPCIRSEAESGGEETNNSANDIPIQSSLLFSFFLFLFLKYCL